MTKLSISLGQMQIKLAHVEDNLITAEQMIGEAAARASDMIILPELWSTGYDLEKRHRLRRRVGRRYVCPTG